MSTEIRDEIYKRILLSRALHRAGEASCSNKNDQIEFTKGILLLHDAAEAVLGALADHLHANLSGNHYLLSYYEIIKKADPEHREIPYKTQMRNLNTLRNNAKHQGILPDPKSNIHLPNIIYSLASEICTTHFGLDYNTVSLKSLIKTEDVFRQIDIAEKEIQDGKIDKALISLAYAMYSICEYSTIPSNTSLEPTKGDITYEFSDPHSLSHIVILLGFGVDVYLYRRFKDLTPLIGKRNDTGELFYWWDKNYGHAENWTLENASFCLNFCIDTALKFQRFQHEGFTIHPYFLFFEDLIEPSGEEAIIWNVSLYPEVVPHRQNITKIPLLRLKKGESIIGIAYDYKDRLAEWFIISKNIPTKNGELHGVGYVSKDDVIITQQRNKIKMF